MADFPQRVRVDIAVNRELAAVALTLDHRDNGTVVETASRAAVLAALRESAAAYGWMCWPYPDDDLDGVFAAAKVRVEELWPPAPSPVTEHPEGDDATD